MNIGMNLEVHFYQQDEASVYLECKNSGKYEKFGEILLLCCYTLRHIVNFKDDEPIASSIAAFLLQIDNLIDLAEHDIPDVAKLVVYKGSPGRKRFLATLKCTDENLIFKLKAKGFGLFARGMGYYGPNSIVVLLRYLVKKRVNEHEFINALSQAVKKCGEVYYSGQLSLSTQYHFALMIACEIFEEEIEELLSEYELSDFDMSTYKKKINKIYQVKTIAALVGRGLFWIGLLYIIGHSVYTSYLIKDGS